MGEGALLGGIAAAVALAVGAVRIVFALLGGVRIRFDELQVIFFYVAGFVLAGSVMGLLAPMHRTRMGRFTIGIVGAGVAVFVMVRGFRGPLAGWTGVEWFIVLVGALFYGVVVGRLIDP